MLLMKKDTGVRLFLLSIALTTVGSVMKLMKVDLLPDILLGLGMATFIVALVLILKKIFRQHTG